MKRIIYILSLCFTLGLSSCNDYLTVNSPDQLTSASFWRSKQDVESALASAYSQMYMMQYSDDEWSFSEVKWPVEGYHGDDVNMGNDAMNYPNWVDLYNFTYTNGNSQFSMYWSGCYRGISYANQIIAKLDEVPEATLNATDRAHLLAEAKFLRGYYHMMLLLNWENIVIRDSYITSGEASALDKALATRPEAWDFIIKDLTDATTLPQSYDADNVGRATSGAAYAYLGWAYLTRASEESAQKTQYLTSAVDAFNKVTGYTLEKNFAGLFNGSMKNNKESIFEMQFSLSDANGALYRTQLHRWTGCAELMGWDEILPSNALMKAFMEEGQTATTGLYDSRLYQSVYYQCDYFNDGTGKVYGKNYADWFNTDGKAYNRPAFRKLMPATIEGLELDESDINIPLMRYANVLLMKAEALNGLDKTTDAIPLINQVRSVHGDMPAMKGSDAMAVQSQIEHERMIEFPLENLRWYDLRRWGKTDAALKAAGRTGFDNSKLFYPTPQTELNANPLAK